MAVTFVFHLSAFAQSPMSYRTPELRRLANAVSLQVHNEESGYHHEIINGVSYVYHINKGVIDHVGLSLFHDEIKSVAKTPVLDFLERYFLTLQHPGDKTVEYLLRSDRFRFLIGNMQTIKTLNDSDAFSYNYAMRLYHASWKRNGRDIFSVAFPKDYQLISGENKIEAEKLLERDVENTTFAVGQPMIDKHQLVASPQAGFYTLPGETYEIAKITSNLYFTGDSIKGYRLINDLSHADESAANLMLSLYTPGDYTLNINQALYGYKRKTFSVPLRQWIAFCQQHDCQLYFGVESREKTAIDAAVFAVNSKMGYVHIMTAKIPLTVIDNGKGEIEARLDCYVPTSNVMNLYDRYYKNKRLTPRLYE